MDFEVFFQLVVAGLIAGSAYALLGVGFGLILGVTGRFHLAHASAYTLAAYAAVLTVSETGIPFPIALIFGLIAGILVGVLIEVLIYRNVIAGGGSLLTVFVASLGITIVVENAIRLWAPGTARVLPGFPSHIFDIEGVRFSLLEVTLVMSAWFLIASLWAFLRYAPQGRLINAVRVNPEMAMTVGINPNMVYVLVFAIGSLLGGVAAIFHAMDTAASPNMGFQPIFIAFVVGFLGGLYKVVPVALAGVFIGLLEFVPAYWLQAKWSPLLVFGALFVYVIVLSLNVEQWKVVQRGRSMLWRRPATAG